MDLFVHVCVCVCAGSRWAESTGLGSNWCGVEAINPFLASLAVSDLVFLLFCVPIRVRTYHFDCISRMLRHALRSAHATLTPIRHTAEYRLRHLTCHPLRTSFDHFLAFLASDAGRALRRQFRFHRPINGAQKQKYS